MTLILAARAAQKMTSHYVMRRLSVAILMMVCIAMARAETELPQQSVVVPGFSEQVARERLM